MQAGIRAGESWEGSADYYTPDRLGFPSTDYKIWHNWAAPGMKPIGWLELQVSGYLFLQVRVDTITHKTFGWSCHQLSVPGPLWCCEMWLPVSIMFMLCCIALAPEGHPERSP